MLDKTESIAGDQKQMRTNRGRRIQFHFTHVEHFDGLRDEGWHRGQAVKACCLCNSCLSVSGESDPPGNMQSAGERGHQARAGEDVRAEDQVQVQW